MSDVEPTAFDYAFRYAELMKQRESELGSYVGDGPTAEQAEALAAKLVPVSQFQKNVGCSTVWDAFRVALETEMAWLFPERDPLGEPMIRALREIQDITGTALESSGPEWKNQLEKLVNVHLVANAAQRQVKLRVNGISWRLVLARPLYWLGIKGLATRLADAEYRRWKA